MAKSIKFKNNHFLDTSGIIHSSNGAYGRFTIDKMLPVVSGQGPFYSTQYMQLGYISCDLSEQSNWSDIVLMVSSSFYGVQHWSNHIITIGQANSIKAGYMYLSGNSRNFYLKKDTTNKRIYLYAYVNGGNGFGTWSVNVLNKLSCNWTTEFVFNVNKEDSWEKIDLTNKGPTEVLYDNSSGIVAGSGGNSVGVSLPVTHFNAILIEHASGTCVVSTRLNAYNKGFGMSMYWFNDGWTGTFYNNTIYKIIGLR